MSVFPRLFFVSQRCEFKNTTKNVLQKYRVEKFLPKNWLISGLSGNPQFAPAVMGFIARAMRVSHHYSTPSVPNFSGLCAPVFCTQVMPVSMTDLLREALVDPLTRLARE
jgi:hypothetical protein